MINLLFVLSLFFGILISLMMHKYVVKHPQLSLFVAVLPYIILGLLSAPSLYPQLEEWRITYVGGMVAFMLTYIIQERIDAERIAKN